VVITKWKTQIKKGTLSMIIMLLLRDGERYGFEIISMLKDNHDLDVAEGTIYPLLSRLTKERLIISKWVYANTGHPRKYYSLTPKGRECLGEMLREWRNHIDFVQGVISGIQKSQLKVAHAK